MCSRVSANSQVCPRAVLSRERRTGWAAVAHSPRPPMVAAPTAEVMWSYPGAMSVVRGPRV